MTKKGLIGSERRRSSCLLITHTLVEWTDRDCDWTGKIVPSIDFRVIDLKIGSKNAKRTLLFS